jgi:hypothetical protein
MVKYRMQGPEFNIYSVNKEQGMKNDCTAGLLYFLSES